MIETIIDRSLPEFVRSEYPAFVTFIRAYYQFLQQQTHTLDISSNLINYRDHEQTLDTFADHFNNEILKNVPEEVIADKKLLARLIKQFYLNKGNSESYKFLFRCLYGEDVELYYPKVDVLRASDGRWYQQQSIKILVDSNNAGVFEMYINKRIIGQTSGAGAIVESAVEYNERGENIIEVSLSQLRGTFQQGETVRIYYTDQDGLQQYYEDIIASIFTAVDVVARGSGYAQQDLFLVKDQDGNEIGKGEVTKVSRGNVLSITIDDGGQGYYGEYYETNIFYNMPLTYTYSSNYLADTPISVYASTPMNQSISTQTIPDLYTDTIIITDSENGSGFGAFAQLTTVDIDNNRAALTIDVIREGDIYENPSAIINSFTGAGSGAVLTVEGGGGAIAAARLQDFPHIISSDNDSNGITATLDFSISGDGNASGELVVGGFANYPGRWLTDDSHLSSTKRLQDNNFYQDFSYVVKVNKSINQWKDIVKQLLHPAGQAMFGEISFKQTIPSGNVSTTSYITIE